MAKRAAATASKKPRATRHAKSIRPKGGGKQLTQFKPGERRVGRAKGTKNKLGVRVKEAILEAAERSGFNGKGKDGAVGYLVWLSRVEPAVFGRMLEKVMPLQIDVKDTTKKDMTPAQAVQRLEERGLPVPGALRALAEGVGRAIVEQDDARYEAELDGQGYEGADDESDEEEDEESEDELETDDAS